MYKCDNFHANMGDSQKPRWKFEQGVFLIAVCLLVLPLSTSVTEEFSTTSPPIALQDIGYDGTWDKFCNPDQINNDFHFYLEHELRVLRYLICDMRAEDKINRESMSPFIAYKYCEMMRHQADNILEDLIDRFSFVGNENMRAKLLAEGPMNTTTECYNVTVRAFEKTCIDHQNPFHRMFKPLLSRACVSNWLTTDKILLHIREVCTGRRMSGNIDWQTIIDSVPYRGQKSTPTETIE